MDRRVLRVNVGKFLLTKDFSILGLDDQLKNQLKSNGVSYFFPVQRLVIPWLLKSERFRFYRPNDICVSAPTGSGKTLGTLFLCLSLFIEYRKGPKTFQLKAEIVFQQSLSIFS